MKHILNDISQEEKNRILEQHTGGKQLVIENFNKLLNNKLGTVKTLISEQGEGGENPVVIDEAGADRDWWTLDLEPKLKEAGFKTQVDPPFGGHPCYYKCCTYMYKGSHSTGTNVFLDCGEGSTGVWEIGVYRKGNEDLKKFPAGQEGAIQAVKYALSLG